MKRPPLLLPWLVLGLLLSVNAEAHIVSIRLGDFFMGALHPMTDPVDWAVWLGCALLGARAGRESARWLVVTVPLALVGGLAAVLMTARLPMTGLVEALPLLIIGLLLASGLTLSAVRLVGAVSVLMLLRGAANAAGLRVGADVALYLSGLACAGYVAITLLGALLLQGFTDAAVPAWRRIAVRVLGSWMAAAGLMLLALGLRG
jgi:hydrogenase/urease accessory protein HupE